MYLDKKCCTSVIIVDPRLTNCLSLHSYTAPDGTPVTVKFVADANGYQPESALLPVAPAFPHPIPQFVLDQIAKAAAEDAARDSSEEGYSYA